MKRENLEHTKNKISGKKERWAFRIDWWSDNAVKRLGRRSRADKFIFKQQALFPTGVVSAFWQGRFHYRSSGKIRVRSNRDSRYIVKLYLFQESDEHPWWSEQILSFESTIDITRHCRRASMSHSKTKRSTRLQAT